MLRLKDDAPFADLPPLLSEQKLADILQVPLSRVQAWRRSGRLGPFLKAGTQRLMRRDALAAWVHAREA
jgi:excisionase family DNA binding protein